MVGNYEPYSKPPVTLTAHSEAMLDARTFPVLYGLNSKGEVKIWTIQALVDVKGKSWVRTTHGQIEGKLQDNLKEVKKGKNIGKKNETTPFQQAEKDAESKFNKQKKKGYREYVPHPDEIKLPMLANKYEDRVRNLEWPVYVQPKLDGIRCVVTKNTDGTISKLSREGDEFSTLEHLDPDLEGMLDIGESFDGELYSPNLTFQELVSAVKKKRRGLTECVEYHVYDVPDRYLGFQDRYLLYQEKIRDSSGLVKPLGSLLAHYDEQVRDYHKQWVRQGFEGTIVRNARGGYIYQHRSNNLLKHKDFEDAEFLVADIKEGEGRSANQAVLICETHKGHRFSVRCKGPDHYREYQLQNPREFVGKQLTVRFFERTQDGVPRFPVGIAVRDYE